MSERQRPLEFGETRWPARRTDPETSHAGAAHVAQSLGERQATVYACVYLAREYGRIAAEVNSLCGDGSWKRLSELAQRGLIVRTENVRIAPSGLKQRVWIASEYVS